MHRDQWRLNNRAPDNWYKFHPFRLTADCASQQIATLDDRFGSIVRIGCRYGKEPLIRDAPKADVERIRLSVPASGAGRIHGLRPACSSRCSILLNKSASTSGGAVRHLTTLDQRSIGGAAISFLGSVTTRRSSLRCSRCPQCWARHLTRGRHSR